MRRSLAWYSAPVSFVHVPSWADFITITFGFRFSVHTGMIPTWACSSPLDDIESWVGAFQLPGHFAWPAPTRGDFYFASDRGRLGHPRVYTVGLHRPDPVAPEKPYFIG